MTRGAAARNGRRRAASWPQYTPRPTGFGAMAFMEPYRKALDLSRATGGAGHGAIPGKDRFGVSLRQNQRDPDAWVSNNPGSAHDHSSLAAQARPRRRRRWRRHRHLDRLSPGADGLEGHRAARARPAHVRHDLACRRPHGDVRIDVGDVDASCASTRATSTAGSRPRPGRRRASCRSASSRSRPTRTASRNIRRVSAFNRYCGVDVQEISPRAGAGAVPAREGGRHRGRLLREGRRPGEPGRRHDGARQGRAHARREDPRGRGGDRGAAEERTCHRREHAVRRHPDRLRRELRRPVGTRARCAVGRRDFEPGRRALLPDHRSDQGPAAEHAGARGPVCLRLLPRRKAAA